VDAVVGLGAAGCGIAEGFRNYPQYKIYKIDTGLKGYKKDGFYDMPRQESHQDYEANCPSLKRFFKGLSGKEVLFVVAGTDEVSGAALQILKSLHLVCSISVLYVQLDTELISAEAALQDRLTCGVLQEYARSGVFKGIYLLNQLNLEDILGDLPLKEHQARLEALVVNTIHMINVFKHTSPVIDTTSKVHELTRVWTFGTVDLENGEEKQFFPLVAPTERVFYYAIPEEDIDSDPKLLSKIKKQIKDATDEECHASYMVHATKYDKPYVYCLYGTRYVQPV